MNDGRHMMNDDEQGPIAISHLSDSGDLKMQFMFMKIVFYDISVLSWAWPKEFHFLIHI